MLLKPESFAVIGASVNPNKVGGAILNNLLKSKYKVYPVNPNHEVINGVKCYKSIKEVKATHAVIAVPARIVPKVMSECAEAGVKVAIIISSGFAETGNKELQEQVMSIARASNIRVLGPNVLGVIMPGEFNASFFNNDLISGEISFISQSGALGVAVLDELISNKIGLRAFISVGNNEDLTITEVMKELIKDDKTRVIMIYAESLRNGKEFMKAVKKSGKPVYVLKGGSTIQGAKATTSHTGSMAGSDKVYSAAFKQCGAVRVKSLKELINTSLLSAKYNLTGSKALIITNAGGPGILMTDSLSEQGVIIPKLPVKALKELNNELRGVNWSHDNPVDIVGDATPERYARTLKVLTKYDFYDYIIVILTPQSMTKPLQTAKELMKIKKPVIPCFMGGDSVKQAIKEMKKKLIVFDNIIDLTTTIKNLTARQQ